MVDDEEAIRRAVARALSTRGYQVESAGDGEEALATARTFEPDLVVLDLNMPVLDGLEVCRQLRRWSQVPVLVLSVREDETDKVEALDLGADDYLTKPFGTAELMARVRALLRRRSSSDAHRAEAFHAGETVIDLASRRVTRGDTDVHLTKTEWSLLEELARHPGKLLTQGWLLEQVWGPSYAEDVDVLRVFVSQIRRKIRDDPRRPGIIATEPGIGYRWLLQPDEVDTTADPADTTAAE